MVASNAGADGSARGGRPHGARGLPRAAYVPNSCATPDRFSTPRRRHERQIRSLALGEMGRTAKTVFLLAYLDDEA